MNIDNQTTSGVLEGQAAPIVRAAHYRQPVHPALRRGGGLWRRTGLPGNRLSHPRTHATGHPELPGPQRALLHAARPGVAWEEQAESVVDKLRGLVWALVRLGGVDRGVRNCVSEVRMFRLSTSRRIALRLSVRSAPSYSPAPPSPISQKVELAPGGNCDAC